MEKKYFQISSAVNFHTCANAHVVANVSEIVPEILECCDQRRDLKKKRGYIEGTNNYTEVNKKISKDMHHENKSV